MFIQYMFISEDDYALIYIPLCHTFVGATRHHYNLVINPLPGSPLETIPPEGPKVFFSFFRL